MRSAVVCNEGRFCFRCRRFPFSIRNYYMLAKQAGGNPQLSPSRHYVGRDGLIGLLAAPFRSEDLIDWEELEDGED